MLISYKKNYIFVHIFKTAGTSVMDCFIKDARLIDRLVYGYTPSRMTFLALNRILGISDEGNRRYCGFHKHELARDIKVGVPGYDNFFKFAFVRNPYDLLVSLYHYIGQSRSHRYHNIANQLSFTEFAEWYIGTKPLRQIDFLYESNDRELLVDFVGRYESVEADIKFLCQHLGVQFDELNHKNKSKKRVHSDPRQYFKPGTLEIVQSYFEQDFIKLDYQF